MIFRCCCCCCLGSDVRPGGKQAPERRVPAVSVWPVTGRMGQALSLGRQTQRSLRQCPMAHSDSTTLVSFAL